MGIMYTRYTNQAMNGTKITPPPPILMFSWIDTFRGRVNVSVASQDAALCVTSVGGCSEMDRASRSTGCSTSVFDVTVFFFFYSFFCTPLSGKPSWFYILLVLVCVITLAALPFTPFRGGGDVICSGTPAHRRKSEEEIDSGNGALRGFYLVVGVLAAADAEAVAGQHDGEGDVPRSKSGIFLSLRTD